ncbi:MAG: response regulator [bacterium]
MIVDDEEGIRENLFNILKERGYLVCLAKDGEEALMKIRNSSYHCIILDIKLPKIDGITVLKEAKRIDPKVIVIVITGYDLPYLLKEAKNLSAYACLRKPIDIAQLLSLIEEASGYAYQ